MLAGSYKLSDEEKRQRDELIKQFQPGLLLQMTTSDYHEDDETPPGFLEIGDFVLIIGVEHVKPLYEAKTKKLVGKYNEWKVMTRWGPLIKSDYYLASMARIYE